jgi:hypothetical protein
VTQILPASDDFAWGSPVYGTNVIGWLGARVGTSGWQAGRIHDGYGGAAARSEDQADTTGNTVGVIRRQTPPANVRVAMTSQKVVLSGAVANAQVKTHAVLARLTGGTLTGDGLSTVRLVNCTCYALTIEWVASPGLWRYKLQRFVAGAATVLATFDDPTALVSMFSAPIRLTLEVTTNGGGDVVLNGYVANASLGASFGGTGGPAGSHVVWQAGGSGGLLVSTEADPLPGTPLKTGPFSGAPPDFPDASDTLILSFTDSSGSKITAAGRFGFGLDPEQDIASPPSHSVSNATVVEVWDLTDPDDAVLFLRDEFERVAPLLAEAMIDRFGTAGRNVASDWTCDQASTATAGHYLKRNTGVETAEAPATVDMGQAIPLNGTNEYLELQTAEHTYPPPALPAGTEITIAIWARLNAGSVGGRTFLDASIPGDGFAFALEGGGVATHLTFRGGFGHSPLDVDSDDFDQADYEAQVFCYVAQFKANANPVTGEGRCRFYIGRLGTALLISEEVVSAGIRPQWVSSGTHRVGAFGGPSAFFPGTLDELHVFFHELTAAEVAQVCDANTDPSLFKTMGLVAGWHLDSFTDIGGTDGKRWAPYFAAVAGGVSTDPADWLREKNGITPVTGLVPVSPASRFVALSQRAADSSITQARTMTFHPAGPTSTGGLVLRAGPGSSQGAFTGYQLLVAPGTPARIALLRVIDGVATAMAEQDALSGTVNVAAAADAEIGLAVSQQPLGGPSGPVLLVATVDGDLVPMVSLQPGVVLIDVEGQVVDVADERILSGAAEGFHGFIDGTASLFDTWAPGDSGAAADPSTFPSYELPAEDDGVTGDLAEVLAPAWEIEVIYPAPVLVTPFDSGHGERRVEESYVHRTFRLQLLGGSDDEIAAIRAFWDEHWNALTGAAIPFAFDPSGYLDEQIPGVFCFLEDSLEDGYRGNRRFTTFQVEERRAS